MGTQRISQKVYTELKNAIINGEYACGVQLPTEPELAQKYNIARNTLRAVFRRLADDKLIIRRPAKGTFVNYGASPEKVYFLIPQIEYMTTHDWGAYTLRRIMQGTMAACTDLGKTFIPIAISDDNNNSHINLDRLKVISKDDFVVLPGQWFAPCLEFFCQIGCRLVFLHGQTSNITAQCSNLQKCFQLVCDRRQSFEDLVVQLHAKGLAKVALAIPFLHERNHPVREGYENGCNSVGQKSIEMEITINDLPSSLATITQTFATEKFDCLIINHHDILKNIFYPGKINDFLGLPDNLNIIMIDNDDALCRFDSYWGNFMFDYLQIGYDSATVMHDFEGSVEKKYQAILKAQKEDNVITGILETNRILQI